jgi:hypothetical protein
MAEEDVDADFLLKVSLRLAVDCSTPEKPGPG